MARQKHRRELLPDEDPVFQIAPMIDVLLQILVFFMAITTVEVMRTSAAVKLPVAQNGQKSDTKKDISVINIQWKGDSAPPYVEIDAEPAPTLNIIQDRIANQIRLSPEHRVIIRADRETQYHAIQDVMKAVSDGGCASIAFAVLNQEEVGSAKVASAP